MNATDYRERIASAVSDYCARQTGQAPRGPRPRVLRTWLDVHQDCDNCDSIDGRMMMAYQCPAVCDEGTHVAAVCVICSHLTLSTSHAQPFGLRSALRQAALDAVAEARP